METQNQNTCSKKFLLSVITVQSILLLLGAYVGYKYASKSEITTPEYTYLSDTTNTLKKNNLDTAVADEKLVVASEDGKISFFEFVDIKSDLKNYMAELDKAEK